MVISPIYVAAAGALPALFAMWYFDRLDRKRPEPAGLRRLVALFGGLSVIPTLVLDGVLLGGLGDRAPSAGSYGAALFTSYVVAAMVEETMKVAVVYAVAWDRKSYDERLDAVVYGARAGLGFALVENVFYLLGQVELKGLIVTWILRAVLAVPGHALWTTIACAGSPGRTTRETWGATTARSKARVRSRVQSVTATPPRRPRSRRPRRRARPRSCRPPARCSRWARTARRPRSWPGSTASA